MRKNRFAAFGGGAIIGTLGGLIGLGGAEFRLPLLIGMFGFASLEAVILNKAMSIVVVASALPFRAGTIPFNVLMDHWSVILNLLAGSLSLAISLPAVDAEIGTPLRVQIYASDVSIALEVPVATSILNVLPATITGLADDSGGQSVVRLQVCNQELLAHITRKSALLLISP